MKFAVKPRFSYLELFALSGLYGAIITNTIGMEGFLVGLLATIVASIVMEELTYE